ncbi:MAG: LLM class flavin-dependent oxidoreductase [Rhodospirillaceae bacterium]|nr:LLM class flavin-dependent oxidoreductase [Rhodospirillaceae bacterium]
MVDLGFFAMPLHPKERVYQEVMNENREQILLADKLGLTEAWIGEHQTSIAEPITDPFMFMATTIHQTKNIKYGSAVINLSYHHPVKLAMQIAMFDQISGGRTLVGIGPGGLPSDSEIFGVDRERSYDMMIECVNIMEAVWTQDAPIDIKGTFWDAKLTDFVEEGVGVGLLPKPLQKPFPPIAYAMRSPKSGASRIVAERDWIPISGNFVPAGFVASQWTDYCCQREDIGKRPDPENWRAGRSILVAETNEQAEDYVAREEGGFRHYFHYLRTLEAKRSITSSKERETFVTSQVNEALEDQVLAGDADTVLDRLIAFRDEVGPFGTLLMTGHDWDDKALWQGSMRRLAEDVMPRFNQHAKVSDPAY